MSKTVDNARKERQEQAKAEKFMAESPNRAEVANFVNTLLLEQYMPAIQKDTEAKLDNIKDTFITPLINLLVSKQVFTLNDLFEKTDKLDEPAKDAENSKSN